MDLRKDKRGIAPLIIILVLAGLIGAIYYGIVETGSIVTSQDFVKPLGARLECLPTDAYEGVVIGKIDERQNYQCDGFTEECLFKLTCYGTYIGCDGYYKICNLDGKTSCSSLTEYSLTTKGSNLDLPKIPSGRTYVFSKGLSAINEDVTVVKQEWKPWKLYRLVGGNKYTVNSKNCDITTYDDKSRLISGRVFNNEKVDILYRVGGEGTKWINYIDDWAYGPTTNVFKHQKYGEVYCSGGKIYEIVKLSMADGSLKKLNPASKITLESGKTLNGLGSTLANVECCPNEASCTDNFVYAKAEELAETKQCYSDIQCFNAGGPVPVDGYNYAKYFCNSAGVCEKSANIKVDCTTNSQCASGEICDLSTMNYGKCIKQIPRYCGDSLCDKVAGETYKTCPSDCAIECPEGEVLITQYTSEGGLCFFGYGLCKQIKKQYCSEKSFDWGKVLNWVLIIAAILMLFKLFPVIIPLLRGILKSIPFIGRLIP